jgi:signal transduction histidine kinase
MIKTIVDKIADRIRLGYLTAFIILLITYIVSFIATQNVMRQAKLVNHSSEVIHSLENIVGFVTQSESSARGYLITQRQELKDKYFLSRGRADSAFNSLKLFTSGNEIQQPNLDTLRSLMNEKFNWIDRVFRSFDSSRLISPLILEASDEGILKMTKVENFTQKMENQERQIWRQRDGQLTKSSNTIRIFNLGSLIVAVMFTIYSLLTFTKENKEKQEANAAAVAYRKQLELRVEELAAVNKELVELKEIEKFASTGRIARTIAHEVRNPLTNINLATDQLRILMPDSKQVNMLLAMITRNVQRINHLINDLLSATRRSELNLVKTPIHTVLDSSLEYAKDRIELKHIKVIKEYNSDKCAVMVDKAKIELAFLNIIVNAIESMDDCGTLHISTENKNGKCDVKISDTGKGIDREDLERLFEPYFTTKERGTGLGLTHTQNIILAHNANISVDSGLGKGTSMLVSFDIAGEINFSRI